MEIESICRNCYYGKVSARSNTAANVVTGIVCRRKPLDVRKYPNDWCGEWRSDDKDTKTRAECPL